MAWAFAGCDDAGVVDDGGPGPDVQGAMDGGVPDAPEDAALEDAAVEDIDEASDGGPPDVPRPEGFTPMPLPIETVPRDRVPVAIALGHGRIITSCDHMQSVVLDETYSPDANDHHEHALKGAAFGNGAFVLATGHGAPGHVLHSTNGLDWTQLEAENFNYADGSTGLLPGGTAGVIFDGTQFILLRGRSPRMSSRDGVEWTEFGEPLDRRYFHHRGHRYFPSLGRLFVEGENVDKSERWLLVSDDSGLTFREVDYSMLCRTPAVNAHNMLVGPGSEMETCASFDDGETWEVQTAPEGFGSVLATDEGFVGVRGQRRYLHRFEGEEWIEETIDSSLRIAAAARSPWGWYWFASHRAPHFWLSDDTRTFRSMETPSEGATVRRFVFGYAEPSERCPLLEESTP